ncbi:MAG: hypothetical protein H8E80_08225 [Desulfobacteraceae bacterium]|uniref:Uncharacterized protein n=1 Tax=Candidatus Desulfaltia bathyphila TaxID=2841697 RepID=A0A8J6N7W0_9BACT|nr:hypothetical protein [Candidatus Desulfaltia bathyphila]
MDKERPSLDFISSLFEKKQETRIIKYIFDELSEDTIIEKLIKRNKTEEDND